MDHDFVRRLSVRNFNIYFCVTIYGPHDIFDCSTLSGHQKKLQHCHIGILVSSYYDSSMVGTQSIYLI